MPYSLQPFGSLNTVNANPLNQLGVNALGQYASELEGAVEQAFLESLDFLVNEINSTFGTSLPDPSTVVTDLQNLFGGSGLIGNLLGSLTGGLTGSGGILSGFTGGTSILSQLIGAGGGSGSTLGDFGSLLSGLGTDIEDVITDLTNPGALLGGFAGGSPILSQLPSLLTLPVTAIENLIDDATGNLFPNLFGAIPAANLTNVSIGSLTTAQSNMFSQPLFTTAASITPNSVYVWDGTQTATGATTPGSVTVSANTLTNTLLSNIVNVVAGDNITASMYTKWTGLSYSGTNPIQLVARIYDANKNLIASPLLAAVASPGASSGWEQLTASYTIPTNGAYMCVGISILNTVVGGQVWFGNGMWSKVNQVPGTSVTGVGGIGSTISGDFQNLINTVLGATGTPGSGPLGLGLISDVENALTNQPYTNIQGLLGPDNLGSALGATVDNIWQAVTGLFGTGNSLGTMSNALSNMVGNVSSATTISQNNSSTLANRAVTKPSYYGVDQSADVTFPFSQLAGATMPTIPITSTTSAIGMIGTPDGGIKESVMWIGSSTGTISAFYVNIYSLNTSTGVASLMYASPDIHAAVPSAVATNYYNLPSANFITSTQDSFTRWSSPSPAAALITWQVSSTTHQPTATCTRKALAHHGLHQAVSLHHHRSAPSLTHLTFRSAACPVRLVSPKSLPTHRNSSAVAPAKHSPSHHGWWLATTLTSSSSAMAVADTTPSPKTRAVVPGPGPPGRHSSTVSTYRLPRTLSPSTSAMVVPGLRRSQNHRAAAPAVPLSSPATEPSVPQAVRVPDHPTLTVPARAPTPKQ